MKCAMYSRVSTDRQADEGFSLPAQRERMTQFIQSQAWTITDEYIDDGYSAKNIERPAIQRLLRDMKTGKFEVVVVYRLDRLVRSVIDLHHLLTEFDRYNVKFKSVTEAFDTTSAMGRLFITMVGAMAAWERENLAERVVMGMSRKASEGGRTGAIAPYGYIIGENGKLEINEDEAKWVRWMFENYKKYGLRAMAIELNKRGVRTKKGLTWIASTIQGMLDNPVYIGSLRWHNTGKTKAEKIIVPNAHDSIIDVALFEDVQAIRKERSSKGQKPKSDYAFSGLLKCAKCGGRLMGAKDIHNGVEKRVYRCRADRARDYCKQPTLPEDLITKWFLEFDFFKDAQLQEYHPPQKEVDYDVKTLQKELTKLEGVFERIKKQYRWGDISDNEYQEEKKILTSRMKELSIQLDETPKSYETTEDIITEIRNLRDIWDELPHKGRQAGLRELFEEITVDVKMKSRRHIPAVIEVTEYHVR